MVDEKSSNPVGNRGGKSKDQSIKKLFNPMGDWGWKPEDQWQSANHR